MLRRNEIRKTQNEHRFSKCLIRSYFCSAADTDYGTDEKIDLRFTLSVL